MKNRVIGSKTSQMRGWIQEFRSGLAGVALFVAISLAFLFVADLRERLREVDQPLSWWIERQIRRVIP
jgi:hypothetical protein